MGSLGLAIPALEALVTPPLEFHDLYQQHWETVYRAALRVTGNPPDAEDVLQSVFLRMLNRQLPLDLMGSPARYLRRAATNAAIDLLRRKTSLAETGIKEEHDYGGRESSLLLKERLRRSLAKLPPKDAELFVLCYLEGYSYLELAAEFQMEHGTVASRLHRIRKSLQEDLQK
jgi:RNA polymerase sigma factor (sigma-70 family)